ncbi:hypothetical protein PHMEG_00019233 [Phytophthora megakarya]|uniref:Helitron helicase-like domain-containing protein n=1 Tax=Phytophthora megakarya TaxID=4795 RepID=A0A225VSF8_9STRA|nr:hypothetical protein PHMEG_00019233 [Phytophthora megakarya]
MEKFGKLISTEKFKRALEFAQSNPDSKEAIRMNASLLRLLALVGGTVPFSAFERAATRPKLAAMRNRYGVALHWVTLAPPEQDDLFLHRIARLREQGGWNDCANIFTQKECLFTDFSEQLQQNARARMLVSTQYPALSAQVFERSLESLTRDIIRVPASSTTCTSRTYLALGRGIYGRCAAFNAVVEPHVDGRLHAHITIYGSIVNPSLLWRISCCSEIVPKARQYLDRVHGGRMPRAFEIAAPNAAADFEVIWWLRKKRARYQHALAFGDVSKGNSRTSYM